MLEALFLAVGFITNREGPDLLEPITRNLILNFLTSRHKSIRSLIYKYAGSARVSLNLDPIGKIGIELDSEWHIKNYTGLSLRTRNTLILEGYFTFRMILNLLKKLTPS